MTVGGGFDEFTINNSNAKMSSSGERLFNVIVSPEDEVSSLYQEIEEATGVKASQQRLIYRGRIINDHPPPLALGESSKSETTTAATTTTTTSLNDTNETADSTIINSAEEDKCSAEGDNNDEEDAEPETEPITCDSRKIKDIAGLCDGQTIHLVKKRDVSNDTNGDTASSNGTTNTDDSNTPSSTAGSAARNSGASGRGSLDGSGGAFLAALLGLGGLTEDGSLTRDNGETGASTTTTPSPSSWRSRGRANRRPHYRLAAADLEVPDPGSMEPVRQGLMTLHTLLPHAHLHGEHGASPLEANREWFRGQWLDCRDTVNQWLEATVVEILSPEDVLAEDEIPSNAFSGALSPSQLRRRATVDTDPAVHANDYEGRRRLLLEPCDHGDRNELSGDLVGYRPRSTNKGSSTASPTPLSVFSDAPSTNIRGGDEDTDRAALLPELNRALSQVSTLLGEIVQREQLVEDERRESADLASLRRAHLDLPWQASRESVGVDVDEDFSDDEDYITAEMAELEGQPALSNIAMPHANDTADDNGMTETSESSIHIQPSIGPSPRPVYSQRELRHLATVVDRLGRTLTDAAPHVAALAASLPEEIVPVSDQRDDSASSTEPVTSTSEVSSAPLGGLLSLWSRERRRNSAAEHPRAAANATPRVDPDHVDYASGLVNTTRGEVRSGPRSRSSQDDVANLLGAYLAAASLGGLGGPSDDGNSDDAAAGLGQLLSRGAGNGGVGGGIDIHIHAVVTTGGPGGTGGTTIGLGGGGLGLGGGAGGGTQTGVLGGNTARNLFSSGRSEQ
ncbi:MAG: hypothetical protein SGILL_004756 [Bacillariaceae sp.]